MTALRFRKVHLPFLDTSKCSVLYLGCSPVVTVGEEQVLVSDALMFLNADGQNCPQLVSLSAHGQGGVLWAGCRWTPNSCPWHLCCAWGSRESGQRAELGCQAGEHTSPCSPWPLPGCFHGCNKGRRGKLVISAHSINGGAEGAVVPTAGHQPQLL